MRHVRSKFNVTKNIKKPKSIPSFSYKKNTKTLINGIHSSYNQKNRIKNSRLINIFKQNNNNLFTSHFSNDSSYSKSKNKYLPLSKISSVSKNLSNSYGATICVNNIHSRGHGNINIKLNLNSEIINNNYIQKYKNKNTNYYTINNKFNLNEKIKEKDKYITLLQKELLQTQTLLSKLQNDKEKELSITYNSIKKAKNYSPSTYINNIINNKKTKYFKTAFDAKITQKMKINTNIQKKKINNFNVKINKSIGNFLNRPSLLTINYKNKNSLRPNRKYQFPNQNRKKYSSYSPNRLLFNGVFHYDSFSSLLKNNSNKKRKTSNYSNSNVKKNLFCEIIKLERKNIKSDFLNFIKKCEELKSKTKTILNNYIALSQILSITKIKNIKN